MQTILKVDRREVYEQQLHSKKDKHLANVPVSEFSEKHSVPKSVIWLEAARVKYAEVLLKSKNDTSQAYETKANHRRSFLD